MADGRLDEAPIWSDVRTFDGRRWRGAVDCVAASWPCQPFSVAGKRLGVDDPRHLWPHVARLLDETGAPVLVGENVAGHLNLGFDTVLRDLCRLGYRVAAGLFTASEVGAPHRRERLFVVAHREERGQRELWAAAQSGRGRHADSGESGVVYAGQQLLQGDTAPGGCESAGTRATLTGSDAQLGHPFLPRLEGHRGDESDRDEPGRDDAAAGGPARAASLRYADLPRWPPGPADTAGWQWVLDRWPELAPAVDVAHTRRQSGGAEQQHESRHAVGRGAQEADRVRDR